MNKRQELIDAAHENWNANRDVDPEVMREIGYDTPDTLPDTIERVLGEGTAAETAQLELVTETHVPQPGVKRETPGDKPPRAARTAKDFAARDIARARKEQGVVAHGHDPYPPVPRAV